MLEAPNGNQPLVPQIAASDVGTTLPGITEENQLQFLLELCEAYSDVSTNSNTSAVTQLMQGKLRLQFSSSAKRRPEVNRFGSHAHAFTLLCSPYQSQGLHRAHPASRVPAQQSESGSYLTSYHTLLRSAGQTRARQGSRSHQCSRLKG